MDQKSLSAIPIKKKDLQELLTDANTLIKSARWEILPNVSRDDPNYHQKMLRKKEVAVSIRDLIGSIHPDDDLLNEQQLHVLRTIRSGIQVALHVSRDYCKRSGVPSQIPTGATETQKTEIREKEQTAAAIALFVFARCILWHMSSVIGDNAFLKTVNPTLEEVDVTAINHSVTCATFFLGRSIESESHNEDARLIAVVYQFALMLQEEILNRITSLKHVMPFSDITYLLEDSEFSILGFAQIDFARTSSIEFNRLDFGKIVGNRDAKHFMRMDAKRRACYDVKEGKNPFLELGGITPVFMGYGIPGTGKSMLISAYATLLYDICEAIGIPFFFNPLPDNIVDPFQGKSSEKMVNWMQPLQDPSRITFAPIDDGESVLENRTRQGVSEGVKGVIAVFLRYTEGAYAIVRGNSTIGVFTNIPDIIDPAVMSRIQAKFSIMGARTLEDFLDQDYLWWHKLEEFEPGFVQMAMPGTYKWLQSQKELTALSEISEDLRVPRNERVREIFDETLKSHNINEHSFFGHLFLNICKRYPLFSSRDLRNIQTAVNLRIMDFDLPDDWFKNAASFSEKPYAEKMQMILELRRANMKGLDFATIRLEETNRYLDNMAIVADGALDREVEEMVHSLMVKAEAVSRFEKLKKA